MPTNEILMDSTKFGILRGMEHERRGAASTALGTTQEGLVPMSFKDTPNSKTESIPYGYCHCACGERTTIATVDWPDRGHIKGEPKRFVKGHHRRKPRVHGFHPFPSPDGSYQMISLPHGLFAKISNEDAGVASGTVWCVDGRGYVQGNIDGATIKLHRLIMGDTGTLMVDHINGNKLDNRRENLRLANQSQNVWNRTDSGRGASRFIGVWWETKRQRWVASIFVNGQYIRLGSFTDEIEAAKARDRAAIKHFGEFAGLNIAEEE